MDAIDYLVLIQMLIVPILIGLYFGYKNKLKSCFKQSDQVSSTELSNYLVASSEMSSIPIAFSIFATFISTTTFLGVPAEVYTNGAQFWISGFCFFITPWVAISLTGPFFIKLQVGTVFEYFELRFNSMVVRLFGMVCYVIGTIFTTSLFIYGPGTALNAITNLRETYSIIIIGVIATIYTAIGGIKAVIWTDFYQAVLMIACLIIIVAKGLYDIGGFENVWQINLYGGRLETFDFNPDPFIRQSFWANLIGSTFATSLFYSVDQQMVQRFLAAKNKQTAQRALIYHMPLVFSFVTLTCFAGLVLYANYFTCDLFSSAKVSNPNQILGYFVTNNLKDWPGISGLFLGALFCASFSSISSTLSSLSSIIWQDFCMLMPLFKKFDDSKSVKMTKLAVFICGFLSTIIAILIASIKGNLIILCLSFQASLVAPILGVFVLGSFSRFPNKYGVVVGIVFGFAAGLFISLGSSFIQPQYPSLPTSTEFCNMTNMSSFEIYENFLKDSIIRANKLNATYLAHGHRATNVNGFEIIFSLAYLYTFLFTVSITIIFGILGSIGTKSSKVEDRFIMVDIFRVFGSKKPIESETGVKLLVDSSAQSV